MAIRKWVGHVARTGGWVVVAVCLPLGLWWLHYIPTTGKGGLLLAFVATVMPLVWDDIQAVGRAILILTLVILFAVEYRAIDKDRAESAKEMQGEFGKLAEQSNVNLKQILEDEHKHFADVVKAQDDAFAATMETIANSQQQNERKFASLLREQKNLFEHEDALAASLNGRLIPDNDPIPANSCGDIPPDGALLMLGNEDQHNAALAMGFPNVVYKNEFGPVLTVDRSSSGSVDVLLDIRSSDRKIIVRLNRDGFVVNRNNYLEMKHDKSTLQILDEYGDEVLYVRYNNPRVLTIRGIIPLQNSKVSIGLPRGMSFICASNGRNGVDFKVN